MLMVLLLMVMLIMVLGLILLNMAPLLDFMVQLQKLHHYPVLLRLRQLLLRPMLLLLNLLSDKESWLIISLVFAYP